MSAAARAALKEVKGMNRTQFEEYVKRIRIAHFRVHDPKEAKFGPV